MKKKKLKNGLNVNFKQNSQNDIISIGFFFKVGSQNENEENNGITHLLEHFLAETFVEQNKLLGAVANAVTTREYMCFVSKGIVKDFEKIVLIFKNNLILNNQFSIKNKNLKNIVLREINQFNVVAENRNLSRLFKLHLEKDPLRFNVLGKAENIEQITLNQLEQHYGNYLLPDNAVLSIVGNLEADYVINYIEKVFSDWQGTTKVSNDLKPVNLHENKFEIQQWDINKAVIDISFDGINKKNRDLNALKIANKILGDGSTSYLNRLIRQQYGYAYLPYSSLFSFERTGLLHIHIDTIGDYLKQTLKLTAEIFEYIRNKGFTLDEIELAKRDLINENIYNYETSSSQMTRMGQGALFLDDSKENFEQKIKLIDRQDVCDLIKNVFSQKQCIAIGSNDILNCEKEVEILFKGI